MAPQKISHLKKFQKLFLVLSIAFILLNVLPSAMSQEDSCSYPSSVDCTNRDDLGKVIQEWSEGKCPREAVDECSSIWTSQEEDSVEDVENETCISNWECGLWGKCENGKIQRNCNDGCGNEKVETEICSKPEEDAKTYIEEWDCEEDWGICIEGYRTQVCYNNLEEEKINYKECSQTYPEDYPIVFVHGWLGDSNSFDEFKEKMVDDGYTIDYSDWYKYNENPPYWMQLERESLVLLDTTYSYELVGEDSCALKYNIEEHAKKLDEHIEEIKKSAGVDKVNIVAHSMGGLITRYYIQNYGGYESVNKVVTLGTPHEGAKSYTDSLSQFVSSIKQSCSEESFDEAAEQLSSSSDFIYNLNLQNDYSEYVDYYTVFTSYDELVSQESATLDFAKINYPDTLCSAGFPTHNSLRKPSLCPEAYEYVLDALGFEDIEIPKETEIIGQKNLEIQNKENSYSLEEDKSGEQNEIITGKTIDDSSNEKTQKTFLEIIRDFFRNLF